MSTSPLVSEPEPPSSLLPQDPPLAAWLEDEAALDALYAEATQAVWQAYETWITAAQEDVQGPFHEVIRRVAARHRHLLDTARFAADDPALRDPEVLWKRLTTYRAGVRMQVIAPLHEHLEQHPLSENLTQSLLRQLEELVTLADAAPRALRRPEPAGLFSPAEGDATRQRLRKSSVQLRRSFQASRRRWANRVRTLFRQPPVALEPRSRVVPVRRLLRYHLMVRVPEHLVPAHAVLQQATAHEMAQLETALTTWMHQILDAEKTLDHPRFHRPTVPTGPAFSASETPPEAPSADFIEDLIRQTQRLDEALTEIAEGSLLPAHFGADVDLQATADALAEDLRRGGTFLLDKQHLLVPTPEHLPFSKVQKSGSRWKAWHTQATGRLLFQRHLLSLRHDLLALEDALLQRIAEATLTPIFTTFQTYAAAFQEAKEHVSEASKKAQQTGTPEEFGKSLRTLRAQFKMRFQRTFRDLPGLVAAEQALSEPGKPEEDQKQYLLTQLPEALHVHLLSPDHIQVTHPEEHSFRINLRMMAQETFAPPFPDQLRRAAAPLRERILRIWNEAEQIQEIVRFNLNAALEEVEQTPGSAEDTVSVVQTAEKLAIDGLDRAQNTLADLGASLQSPWQTFALTVFRAVQDDWQDLHQRARSEAAREEQWAGFLIRLSRRAQQLQPHIRRTWQALLMQSRRLLRFGHSQAREFIQKGRTAIGVAEGEENAHLVLIDALAHAPALQETLPLVYRKLFTFDPVAEASLLEGRTGDLVRVRQHFERWREGKQASAAVLVLPLGSGQTSILNVLQNTELKHASVQRVQLKDRILEEERLATLLADTLGLSLTAPSLAALEAQLMSQPRPKPLVAYFIDNLEHLVLGAPEGQQLIERTLVFFSRTSTRIFWLAATGVHTWAFIEKTSGVATGLVTSYRLRPLDRPSLEALIINRHRRSGLPAHFIAPPDLSPLLRQRLRRARTDEARQALLREDFFDRLFRHSGQNIMLALYYWLRAVDFEAQEGMVQVNPLEPFDFRFFSRLDAPRAFTLKAFILHHSLTLDEHNRIFRTDDAASTFMFESLLNLGLIEAVRAELRHGGEAEGAGRVLPGERYRIHPMLLHPVSEYLRGRHIIY